MAYLIIPDIKNEKIVCQKSCQHRDCEINREDFGRHNTCIKCGNELKPGESFCYLPEYGQFAKAHWACILQEDLAEDKEVTK